MLAPLTPHIAEELWRRTGGQKSVHKQTWPAWDEEFAKEETITFVIQVDGRVRHRVEVPPDISKEAAQKMAMESEQVKSHLQDKEIIKIIFVPRKLLNIVTWENPYQSLQRELRELLLEALRRHNGRITEEEFDEAFGGLRNFVSLKDRLLLKRDGVFEWKPEIVSFQDLQRKVAIDLGEKGQKIKKLFESSKELTKRTRYPLITPARKRTQIKPSTGFENPVYGFDVIIRPPAESSDNPYDQEDPTLHVGAHSFAVVIHIVLEGRNCVIDAEKKYCFRVVWGRHFEGRQGEAILNTFQVAEFTVLAYLKEKKYPDLIIYLAEKAQNAVAGTLSCIPI